ncbi:MAG TPA: hypothetical protein VH352_11105 [Pseudonocardiaceae bacterium]|nr:hypothetical protein [Pseudonocardiaceae bacterium]
MTSTTNRRFWTVAAAAGVAATVLGGSTAVAATQANATGISLPAGFTATVFAAGGKTITGPDDITKLDDNLFVAYQNGVGAMGEPAPSGATASTVVEYDTHGTQVASWTLTGKVDGLGADPTRDRVIATVNEDGNSSLYTIAPREHSHDRAAHGVTHYQYSPNPLPHGGGTDSVVVRDGTIFITASAPAADANGTTFSGPALFTATLADGTATVTPVLRDNSVATDAVTGKPVTLNLSDPDSSEIVPRSAPRFGGDVLLDSQGDGELIFLAHPGRHGQRATVLSLSTQVDDTTFATATRGTLYVVDSPNNRVIAIHGPFHRGQSFGSVPSGSPTPTVLGNVDLNTGTVTTFATGFASPKGLLFIPSGDDA